MRLATDHGRGQRTAPTSPSAIGTAEATAPHGTPIFLPQVEQATVVSGPSMHLRQRRIAAW
jgi:hypothetical protein